MTKKRTTILALVYAILISMTAVSFSLYNVNLPVKTATIGTKIFDISKKVDDVDATVKDTRYLKQTLTWLFSAFNTSAISGSNYDLNVQVKLSSAVTAGEVVLYDQSGTQELARASFSGNIATLKKEMLFTPNEGVIVKKLMLKYINIPPDSANTATSEVTVWGTKNDQDIIADVTTNPWCSVSFTPRTGNKTEVQTFINKGLFNQVPLLPKFQNYQNNKIEMITITIDFYEPTDTLTVKCDGTVLVSSTVSNMSSYTSYPNAVVIQTTGGVPITSLNLPGIPNPNLQSSNPVLFKNFVTMDGSFTISFVYNLALAPGNTAFSIYVGYE